MGAQTTLMPAASIRSLLEQTVDYAGLFPPASLGMREAVRNYAEYLRSPDSWMLSRLIVPVARLGEFEHESKGWLPSGSSPWRISALCGTDLTRDMTNASDFNTRTIGATVDAIEFTATRVEEILAASSCVPRTLRAFVEIPIESDPTLLLRTIGRARFCAKVRTGGVTVDAFPTSNDLARFICACADHAIPFKATAGLHHPLRATYNLTYAPGSEQGKMFGYLNLLFAAAFAKAGMPMPDVQRILEEESPGAFHFDDAGASWRTHRCATEELKRCRHDCVLSFGSCSFREPVDDLKSIHLLWDDDERDP